MSPSQTQVTVSPIAIVVVLVPLAASTKYAPPWPTWTVHVAAEADPAVASNLCLEGNRFKATIDWQKTDGTHGSGTAVSLTDDSGYFWFFDPTNIEAVMKVLNGCAINNAYWVFLAGLTNVEVATTVTDTQMGAVYSNTNPQGTAFAPVQATNALPSSCP